MKKTHLFLSAILVCSMAVGNRSNAQTSKNVSFLTDVKTMEKTLSLFEPLGSINIKAMRDFRRNYPNVGGESWYTFKDGFAVRFKEDGIQYMVGYNRTGNWQYIITSYDEKKLPAAVRAMVKSTYYDYSITIIEEITGLQQTVYLVHMQDEFTWKILMVSDGEMSVIEDFNKQ